VQAGELARACRLERDAGGDALDVYRREPLLEDRALLSLPNVVLFLHTGGGCYCSWEIDTPAVLRNFERFFVGQAEGIII
jgi:phosphoglycerate dehydrogenase-like enzyme